MRLLILAVFTTFLASSCNKRMCEKEGKGKVGPVNATVEWAGMQAVDGLEWVLRLDSATEKPLNLPKEFEQDGLPVKITYEPTTEKYGCFCRDGFIYMVRILSIDKR